MLQEENILSAEYIVVGAGAIGLQMGSLLEAAGNDYLILEESVKPEDLFKKNTEDQNQTVHAEGCDIAWNQLRIIYNTLPFHIDRRNGYEIIDQRGRVYRCQVLLIADGLSRGGYFNDTAFARSCWPARRSGQSYPAVTGMFESLNQANMYFLCASAFYQNPHAISNANRIKVFNFILENAPESRNTEIVDAEKLLSLSHS